MIISGFPGIGKTYCSNNTTDCTTDCTISDSDSSKFSWISKGVRHPNFPQNYINHIIELDKSNDFVMVSSHKTVIQHLLDNDIKFYLVYPDRSLKDEYLKRFKSRGSDEEFISLIENNWDNFITDIENYNFSHSIRLRSGEFLSYCIKFLTGRRYFYGF